LYNLKGINEEVAATARRINKEFQAFTGSTGLLIDTQEDSSARAATMKNQLAADQRLADARIVQARQDASESERDAAKRDEISIAAADLVAGKSLAGYSSEAKQQAFNSLPPNIAAPIRVLQGLRGNLDVDLQGSLGLRASLAVDSANPDQWEALYQQYWLPMYQANNSKPTVANVYFKGAAGENFGAKFEAYHAQRAGKPADLLAQAAAFSISLRPLQSRITPLDKDEKEKARAAILKYAKSKNSDGKFFGSQDSLSPRAAQDLLNAVESTVRDNRSGASVGVIAQQTIVNLLSSGGVIGGGQYWKENSGQPSMLDYIAQGGKSIEQTKASEIIPPEQSNAAISSSIAKLSKSVGFLEEPHVSYANVNGIPTFALTGELKNGTNTTVYLSAETIRREHMQTSKKIPLTPPGKSLTGMVVPKTLNFK
jgi:hypothetical protein